MMLASLAVIKGYREYIARRISEQESFISMLSHMEGKINRYLTPIVESLSDFIDDNLTRIGFFERMADGDSVYDAFNNVSAKLSVGEETKETLSETFGALSGRYKDEVLKKLREGISRLEGILSLEREELSKKERVASVVLVAAVLGIFILLV